jgi:hypothetical protein
MGTECGVPERFTPYFPAKGTAVGEPGIAPGAAQAQGTREPPSTDGAGLG